MANTVADIINEAAIYIGLIRPGDTLATAIQTDAFTRLNQMWGSWGTEEATSNLWYHQTFTVTAGTQSYTVGTGGTLVATANPIRIFAWRSASGNFQNAGQVIGYPAFEEQTKDALGSSSVLCTHVAADNAYSPTNIKIFPTPAATPGSLTLDYLAQMAQFTSTAQSLSLAPEFELALWTNLAVLLYPIYARSSYDPTVLVSMAQNAKATIAAKNQAILNAGKAA